MNPWILKIYIRYVKLTDKLLKNYRRSQLNNTDFSIICNNCWGGFVYRRYGLGYLTPTVGTYFFAEDFIKLCQDVRHYMETPLVFIPCAESKHKEALIQKGQQQVLIGKLDDIEVVFLHYHTEQEAKEKWERRASRINYDNLIFKFSKMNGCTEDELKAFDNLPHSKKICFVPPGEEKNIQCAVSFKSAEGKGEITNDTGEYARYIDITAMINARHVNGTKMQ